MHFLFCWLKALWIVLRSVGIFGAIVGVIYGLNELGSRLSRRYGTGWATAAVALVGLALFSLVVAIAICWGQDGQ